MDGVDWKTYERFLKEWEAYCLEHAITQKSDITEESAEVGKEMRKPIRPPKADEANSTLVPAGLIALSGKHSCSAIRMCRGRYSGEIFK